MRFGFASGDIGGARALIPVILSAVASGHQVQVLQHGAIAIEYESQQVPWMWIPNDTPTSAITVDVFAFSSSVSDLEPLRWARDMQQSGTPILHLLDHWTNYHKRLVAPGHAVLQPNVYVVMDLTAAKQVKAAGFRPSTVKITGSPAMATVEQNAVNRAGPVVFISEPVSKDQGSDKCSASFRGYTEDQVLDLVLAARAKHAPNIPLWVFPHPRESTKKICNVLLKNGLPNDGTLGGLAPTSKRKAILKNTRGFIGMASILLYEGWLAGIPVLSIQPNLRSDMLHYLLGRPGISFCKDSAEVGHTFKKWVTDDQTNMLHLALAREERQRHKSAASNVVAEMVMASEHYA